MHGKVKWFSAEKVMASLKEKMAATFSLLLRYSEDGFKSLTEGQEVDFDIVDGARVVRRLLTQLKPNRALSGYRL